MSAGIMHPDEDHPAALLSAWLDDAMVQRIQVAVDVACGPGIEFVAAEVLADVVQALSRQALVPAATILSISAPAPRR